MRTKIFLVVLFGIALLCLYGPAGGTQYPVEKGAPVPEVLDAYFTKMSSIYPPGTKPGKESTSLVASRTQTIAFWKLKPRDTDVPSMKSSMFFSIYQPTAWSITKVQEAGDFAKAKVKMTVGSPIQKKLNRYSKDVEYTLVRVDGNWYITGFKETDTKAGIKEEPEEQPAPVQAAGDNAEQTLSDYLTALSDIFTPKDDNPSANPAMHFQKAIKKTEHFWQSGKGKKREATQSVSLFVTMQPKSWSIKSVDISGNKAEAMVVVTPGAPMMERTGEKKVKYGLVLEKDKWYLSEYTPPQM